jgi:hypothetical protein
LQRLCRTVCFHLRQRVAARTGPGCGASRTRAEVWSRSRAMVLRRGLSWAMKLFLVRGDLDFHWLRPAGNDGWSWRGGVPVSWAWTEPNLTVSEAGAEFLAVDCLPMNTGCDGLILSGFARSVLGEMLRPAGEFWPVRVQGREYWWFNCLASVDALDPSGTEADWEEVSGDWGSLRWIATTRRLGFRAGAVRQAPPMFRIPEFPQGSLFASELLERTVERHRLTGFRFDLVWSSEAGGVPDPPGLGFAGVFEEAAPGDAVRKRARARAVLERRAGIGRGE